MNLRWNGGKAKAARDLWSLAPSRVAEYREPFAGNASMLWHVPTQVKRWINDVDPDLIRYHLAMQSRSDYIEELLALRERHHTADDLKRAFSLAKIEWYFYDCPVAYFFLNRLCYGQVVRRSRNNVATFWYSMMNNGFNAITRERLEASRGIYKGVQITEGNYWDLIDAPGEDVWLMLDPPYLLRNKGSAIYEYDFDVRQHEELRERLGACKHRWLMTIGNCGLSHRLWVNDGRFNVYNRKYTYSSVQRKRYRNAYELVITNY
jgi:DNA adenine methylase